MLTYRKRMKKAVKVAKAHRNFFTLKIFRKEMRIGYYPAAKIITQMEYLGYIGPYNGEKRDVYL